MKTKRTIQTVIDQKDYDGIFGVVDSNTGRYLVLFGSDVIFTIVDFDWIIYSKNDVKILKIHRDDMIHFIVDEFDGNRRLVNVIFKMMRLKTCESIGYNQNQQAANQVLYLS